MSLHSGYRLLAKVLHRQSSAAGDRCGRACGSPYELGVGGENGKRKVDMAVVELGRDNFDTTIRENDFVVVDFWAPWCAPCRTFAPIYEKVAEQHPDLVFAKLNTEQEQDVAQHFQIRSIPTLMIFREQIIIFLQPGMLPEAALSDVIGRARSLDMDDVRQQIEAQRSAQS